MLVGCWLHTYPSLKTKPRDVIKLQNDCRVIFVMNKSRKCSPNIFKAVY